MMHFLRKLRSTLSILATLFMARTFGKYEFSCWNGESMRAIYTWRGERWAFPTGPIEGEEP